MVTIEDDGDELRSIVTPELRLRFFRLVDRWSHAVDIRAGHWQTLAEAVEWTPAADDPTRVVSPTYQELYFQPDGEAVVALLVGQAGPHHFSASVRVSHRVYGSKSPRSAGLEYTESRVEFDVADRCRAEVKSLECHYVVHAPPFVSHHEDSRDLDSAEGFSRGWRAGLLWECRGVDNDNVVVRGLGDRSEFSRVALTDRTPNGGWSVRVAPAVLTPGGTNRIRYAWSHSRASNRPESEG